MANKFIVFAVFAAVVGASLASSETACSRSEDGISYRDGSAAKWRKAALAFYRATKAKISSIREENMAEWQGNMTAGDEVFLNRYVADEEQRAEELVLCDELNKDMSNTLLQAIEAAYACEDYSSTIKIINKYQNQISYERVMTDYKTLAGATYELTTGVTQMKKLYEAFFSAIRALAGRICGVSRRNTNYAAYDEVEDWTTLVFNYCKN